MPVVDEGGIWASINSFMMDLMRSSGADVIVQTVPELRQEGRIFIPHTGQLLIMGCPWEMDNS